MSEKLTLVRSEPFLAQLWEMPPQGKMRHAQSHWKLSSNHQSQYDRNAHSQEEGLG